MGALHLSHCTDRMLGSHVMAYCLSCQKNPETCSLNHLSFVHFCGLLMAELALWSCNGELLLCGLEKGKQ